jgi:hypothetical protein
MIKVLLQGLQKTGAVNFASKYLDDGLRFVKKSVSMKHLNTIETVGTVSSVGTLLTGTMAGQAEGSFGDYFTGFGDLQQEQFHENGGDQSGTRKAHIGKIMQNFALNAISLIPSGKLAAKLGVNGVKTLYKGIAGWQAASVASDWVWDDNGGLIEDSTDTAMGLASAARFTKLLSIL